MLAVREVRALLRSVAHSCSRAFRLTGSDNVARRSHSGPSRSASTPAK
ncbi:hypothetical protein [Phytohabitans rumicis]|nr:hypothetical protein [Phytohabitans rumicis]